MGEVELVNADDWEARAMFGLRLCRGDLVVKIKLMVERSLNMSQTHHLMTSHESRSLKHGNDDSFL